MKFPFVMPRKTFPDGEKGMDFLGILVNKY